MNTIERRYYKLIRLHCKPVTISAKNKVIILDGGYKITDFDPVVTEALEAFQQAGYKIFTQTVMQWPY